MPTEIFNQLKTLREGIAESLKKDPRYLTLQALDKSIAEIGGVLSASGLMASEAAAAPAAFSVEPGTIVPASSAPGQAAQAGAVRDRAPKPAGEWDRCVGRHRGRRRSARRSPGQGPPARPPRRPRSRSRKTKGTPTRNPSQPDRPRDTTQIRRPRTRRSSLSRRAEDIVHPVAEAHPVHLEPAGEDQHPAAVGSEAEPERPAEVERSEPPPAETSPIPADVPHLEGAAPEPVPAAAQAHEVQATQMPEEASAEVFHGWASGYKLMAPKPGAALYQPSIAVKFGRLPGKVDLRPLLSPIEDQGEVRSCVASAVAGAYEAWVRKAHKQDEPVSRLFIYYNARWRDGTQDEDEGSAIQLAMETLCRFGACSEAVWPSDPHLALKKPGAAAYEAAAPYRVADMAKVPLKLDAWKQALAEGKPNRVRLRVVRDLR